MVADLCVQKFRGSEVEAARDMSSSVPQACVAVVDPDSQMVAERGGNRGEEGVCAVGGADDVDIMGKREKLFASLESRSDLS